MVSLSTRNVFASRRSSCCKRSRRVTPGGSSGTLPIGTYLIESSNPRLAGLDGAVECYAAFLYQLAVN